MDRGAEGQGTKSIAGTVEDRVGEPPSETGWRAPLEERISEDLASFEVHPSLVGRIVERLPFWISQYLSAQRTGKNRLDRLTKTERSAEAKRMAEARWGKKRALGVK